MRSVRESAGRRLLLVTSAVHLTNDACFALLYPLFPFMAAELGLSYAQVGLIKAVFSGASSSFQIPAGIVGQRFGEYLVLLLGNAWVGAGLVAMALSSGYLSLLAAALAGGLGGNAQHPLAASLVSRAFQTGRLATAMGTLNFAGDLGKLVGPLAAGVIAVQLGWRPALLAVGLCTAVFSTILLLRRQVEPVAALVKNGDVDTSPGGGDSSWGLWLLLLAGALDSATRGAALTFLPFLFEAKGIGSVGVSALFGVIFAAGAAGKFVCGWLGDRWGAFAIIAATELVTALALVAFLYAPPATTALLAVLFGFALNGTSSALTASVAHVVPAERRARGYGTYFTAALVSQAVSPLAYGLIGDLAGLTPAFVIMAIVTAAIVPLAVPIRRALAVG